jgi:photosystem II stability/assembly factor-like uncharacterized protein
MITSAPSNNWQSVACSADGTNLVAASFVPNSGSSLVCISSDAGSTWAVRDGPGGSVQSVAISPDGRRVSAAAGDTIYVSFDRCASWIRTTVPINWWLSVAYVAGGSRLLAASGQGIYSSIDGGASWTPISAAITNQPGFRWGSIGSSADGKSLIAASWVFGPLGAKPGPVYTSGNSGGTWTLANVPNLLWGCVACSGNGKRMVALARAGQVFESNDSGTTWAVLSSPSEFWQQAVLSADGSRLFAITDGGEIFTSARTPTPWVGLATIRDQLVLSWTVSSMNFVLQRTSNLLDPSAWTDVPSGTALNPTNLQNQVTIPAPNGPAFFRLVSR